MIYRKSLSPLIRSIDSHSKRFCAISVTLNDFKKGTNFVLRIICVYLPADYGSASSDACFTESLGELEGFIQSVPFDNIVIVICGDFNVDFKRTGHFLFYLTQFMLSHNLVSVDCILPIDYTYCRDDNSAHSWPDHILTFSHYGNVIANFSTLNSVDNFSDHLPLSFEIKLSL